MVKYKQLFQSLMKLFAIISVIILISFVPLSSSENVYPAWYFTGATLNFTAFNYHGLENTTPSYIWNFSYRVTFTENGYFNYTYINKIGNKVTFYYGNGTVNDTNGFPALNITDLNFLSKGNISFINKVFLPGYKKIELKVVNVSTFLGQVRSYELIYEESSALTGQRTIYLNYSSYSGILLNENIINYQSNNRTYFIITYTNIPISKTTIWQVLIEFIVAMAFVILLLYFIRRYRKIDYF